MDDSRCATAVVSAGIMYGTLTLQLQDEYEGVLDTFAIVALGTITAITNCGSYLRVQRGLLDEVWVGLLEDEFALLDGHRQTMVTKSFRRLFLWCMTNNLPVMD